jgi:aldose 1-epimerase
MPAVREELWKPGDGPGLSVVTLEVDGARCRIAPQLGFNCLSWEVETPTGWRELLWTAPDIDVNPVATRSGIPILFPFPNRIRDGRFTWEGKQYQLPINSQGKHAIHGFVCYRPWNITKVTSNSVTATFDSRAFPELVRLWPSHFFCTSTYSFQSGGILTFEFTVQNIGEEPLPYGLGFHPYFRIHKEDAQLRSLFDYGKFRKAAEPKWTAWELENLIPTGRMRPLEVDEELLLDGTPLGQQRLDGVYQPDKPCTIITWYLRDSTGLTIQAETEGFNTYVLFTPDHGEAVCIEPYTCTTNAINLHHRGIDTGLLTLRTGESWTASLGWLWFTQGATR